eukprot:XP_019925765.1 PREDICTED: uncharacterized protein LOC105335333 [Crassostrea gigas]
MWCKLFYSLVVTTISLVAFVSGQCTDYKLQTNQYKRSSGYQLGRTDVAISDNFLSEGWYRFQSGAGNDMVTSSPSIAMCGTIYPVWLNGSLPLENEGIVNRTACVVGLTRSCESMISIKIINCGTYNVYYLRKTPILASGYCFGEQVKCPDGQGSETGFTPGCQMLPTITVTPVVNADLEDTPSQIPRLGSSKKSYFECTFDKPSMGPYYFDITWYIHGNEVRRTRNVTYEELSTTRLLPKHWVHQYNLNMVVMCSVRVRETEGGVPTNEMTSSEYQAGIFIYISDVDNTISDRICKLQTDPRFWTFDGKQHDIYSAGEFVLYRHKKRNVEVHALFTACPGDSGNLGAACTCGVAIRVEDSLYVYRTCREVSYQTVNLLAHHSTIYEVCDDKHMVISTESDGFTKITLPSGTVVKYKLHGNWIRYLHIIPSAFDIDNMEGICGNANDNDADDFVAPDGRTPTSDSREDNDIIINTWKIQLTSPNSLFSANPVLENTSNDVQKYCSCATEASNTNNAILKNLEDHHTAVCNITTSLVDCSHQQTTASFLTTCNRVDNNGRKRRALSEVGLNKRSKRVRRSTTDSDDVIDFEPLIYDPSYSFTYIPQIPTWRNGWNESHARQVCEESINNDHVKLECEKYIDIQKMVNHSISSCILDIRVINGEIEQ